jgi:hypothetical protein
VKEMAKFVEFWRMNPNAPWPTDPAEALKLYEMLFAATDNLLKTGVLLEFGLFQNATSGYGIVSGETKDAFKKATAFLPWIEIESHEVVPHETAKEIVRGVLKAQAEQMAAMKR